VVELRKLLENMGSKMTTTTRTNNLSKDIEARKKVKLPYSLAGHKSTRQGKRARKLKDGIIIPKSHNSLKYKKAHKDG
jgi:hypothetical protein